MAISVAPLTTTVMNSVAENRAGIASGINNAVSRAAGLLAIAVLGIVMLQSFNHNLDRRLAALNLPPTVHRAINDQRTKLAGAETPADLPAQSRDQLRDAIDHSFVAAFQHVMWIGAALALASAATAFLLIERRSSPTANEPQAS